MTISTASLRATTGCVLLAAAAGCGSARFGESASVPQEKHASLVVAFAEGKPLRLPDDMPYNLTDSQRVADGAGQAESEANASGNGRCLASAAGKGSATAEFQLGHVLDNRGTEPLSVQVSFDVTYECTLQSDPSDRGKKPDHLGLRVFVRDSNQRLIKEMTLTQEARATGPTSWSGRTSPSFEVTMEPDLAYYFVLAGKVAVTGTDQSGASARLEASALNIQLTPKP